MYEVYDNEQVSVLFHENPLGILRYNWWLRPWANQRVEQSHRRHFRREACHLLRELFGNPYRSIPLELAWLNWNDRTIPKLAQGIYDDRAFDRLPILADALEDAGCHNADILAHCRSDGDHVRGCWVVDLLLGRS